MLNRGAKQGCKKTKIQNSSLQLIDDAPTIIIINFARYIYYKLQDEYKKNSQRINFEYQNQSMAPFVNDNNNLYDLVGVICHFGRHVNSGHYIAYVLENDMWLKYNDSSRELAVILDQ